MLEYRDAEREKIYIIDKKGNKLETNEAIKAVKKAGGQIYLYFGHTETVGNKDLLVQDFTIPVSAEPREGYYTYDTRKYKEGEETKREKHIGNKVKKIVYK